MSEENKPKPESPEVEVGADPPRSDESAAAARETARDLANNAGAMFQGLNQKMQIYLVALAVALVCSFLFGAFKTKVKMGKEFKDAVEISRQITGQNLERKHTSPALVGLQNYSGAIGGKLAFLGAGAGVGILLWSTFARRKDAWIPLGLAGAAGLAALGILMTRSGMGGGSGFAGTSVSINGTLLGWWLPLAATIVATVVAVQRILKA